MQATRKTEIEGFKRLINLTEYAAAQGYVLDRKASSRNSITMRGPGDDKIIVGQDDTSGHWIYFSIRDDRDCGTIIDFVQNRERLTIGELRKALQPWIGETAHPPRRPTRESFAPEVEPITKDLARVRAQFAAMQPVEGTHRYLEFARGARKGLWYSASTPEDSALVIAESAIEALSYHALHTPKAARYFSIAGETNPAQRLLITASCAKLPPGATLIIATNNDDGGRHLAAQLRGLALAAGREDLAILDHAPEGEGADWNDVLQAQLAYTSGG